eukprot:scaffold27716_cov61-Phaeocystis_antarctica.AAC.1
MAAAWPSPCPLYAGCGGFYAGARHCRRKVARACCLGRRRLGRRLARSTRAALASMLARATVWCEVARV